MAEEQINRVERVYDGKLVKVERYDITLPDGKSAQREVIQHPGSVGIIALDSDGRVLLVRQYRLPAGRDLLELPAGTLDPGESPETCALRELREETGYGTRKLEPMGGIYLAPGYTTEYMYFFLAHDLYESPIDGDEDEFIERVRMPWDEALAAIHDGRIVDGKSVAGLLRAADLLDA